jgi:BlaI family transcriptional regulator, penicillinase repressor
MAKQGRPARGDREPTLPDSELEVMRMLWKYQKATARQVWTNLSEEGSRWTYATVNTLLQRLEAKGLATCDKSQMTYVYSPKVNKATVIKKRLKHLVDKLYDGESGPLVMHLLKSQKLSKDDITELQDIVEAAKTAE